jgi:tetratricopeptide (TPR) repeat protein
MKSSNRDSAALPLASGPPRLYPVAISVGLTTYQRERLTRIAELAYSQRGIKTMERAGRELLAIDSDAALYYLAMTAKWQGRIEEARFLFESVHGAYQARAIHALGAILYESGRFDEAAKFYTEAMQVNQGRDVIALAGYRFQASAIKSAQGRHRQSLDDLLSLWPLVRVATKYQPHLWALLHNEIAFELLQLGRLEEAKRAASVAIASPLIAAYPVWRDTAEEIRAAEVQPVLVVVPARPLEQSPQPKVIIRFIVVESRARRKLIKPTIGRAPVIRSIIERVATVAPIHAPPSFRK